MGTVRRLKESERLSDEAPYDLLLHLASGGMGAVFIGRRRGQAIATDHYATVLLEPGPREAESPPQAISSRAGRVRQFQATRAAAD